MSFTYSGDPSASELDAVRFAIGDTVAVAALLQDEEIEFIISNSVAGNNRLAAVFRHAANMLAAKLVKRSLGPQSEDATKRQEYFANMASRYEKLQTYAGVPPLPAYQAEPVFEKNMMANTV